MFNKLYLILKPIVAYWKVVSAVIAICASVYAGVKIIQQAAIENYRQTQIEQKRDLNDSTLLHEIGRIREDIKVIKTNVSEISEKQDIQTRQVNAIDKSLVNHYKQNNTQLKELLQYYEWQQTEKKNSSYQYEGGN